MGVISEISMFLTRRLTPGVLLASVLVPLTGCERWWLDRQMEELCRKDGGIHIYEKVILPASEYNNAGEPFAKYARAAKSLEDRLGPDYRYVVERTVVGGRPDARPERGEGVLERVREAVIRRSDGKLLGQIVRYVRSGGDMFTFGFQPSGSHCPRRLPGLLGSIFAKGQ